jgi:putative addiction module antidote
MVLELKLRRIGNSVGVVLPKEALQHLKVQEGDTLSLTEAPDGSVRLMSASPEVLKQLDIVQDVIHRYRRTLRELAK